MIFWGRKLAHCLIQNRFKFCTWVESRPTAWPKVDSYIFVQLGVNLLASRKSTHCLVRGGQASFMHWESTHCLTRSGLLFCRVGGHFNVRSRAGQSCRVGSRLNIMFSAFFKVMCKGECWNRQDLSRNFHEFSWVSMRFYAHASCQLKKILIL